MAKSRFEYVREFELRDTVLPNTWVVVRVDGESFSDFVKRHGWTKPMDQRGVDLMVSCACELMKKFREIRMAFGQSDEFSFVLPRSCKLFGRRTAKLTSSFASYFAATFVMQWSRFFDVALQDVPSFDARCIVLPTDANVRDYLSWRQADTHINHTLNCCFWALVDRKGMPPDQAQKTIDGTSTAQKHEIMFGAGLNYNDQPQQFRKGTFLFWGLPPAAAAQDAAAARDGAAAPQKRAKPTLQVHTNDIISDEFWTQHPHLIGNE